MFYDEDEPEELLRRKPVQFILEKLIDENAALKERVTTLEGEVDVLQEKVAVLESDEYREALYAEFADRIFSSISAWRGIIRTPMRWENTWRCFSA